MSLISNVYSFKFFIESLGCLCSMEEVGRMPRRCAATRIYLRNLSISLIFHGKLQILLKNFRHWAKIYRRGCQNCIRRVKKIYSWKKVYNFRVILGHRAKNCRL